MQLAIISDARIPERAETIPRPFRERIIAADHTVHAGDFKTAGAFTEVRELSTNLTAVHGNADPADI